MPISGKARLLPSLASRKLTRRVESVRVFDALFNFAHASQILVEFLPVPRSKLALQGAGIIEHKVQDASLLFLTALKALFAFTGRAGAEESLEQEAGIRLGRDGLGGRVPGQIVLISAGISGIAVAGFAH